MKAFARWLFMKTHKTELKIIARQVRAEADAKQRPSWVIGALDTLQILDLLVRK